MIRIHVKIATFLSSIIITNLCLVSYVYPMNLVQPYYAFMKPRYRPDTTFQYGIYAEKGFHFKGYGHDCGHADPLGIWQKKQNALAMLQGFDQTSPQGLLLSMLQMDQSACSLLCFKGKLRHEFSLGFSGRYYLPCDFSIGAYLPVYKVSLDCPTWCSETSIGCERTQQLLLDNFRRQVKTLGEHLDIDSWSRTGTGDLTVLLEWTRDFKQYKDILKNVRLNCRVGPSFPTGKGRDEDLLIAFPFGNDGCMGVVFGGSLEILLGRYMRCGMDVELTHLFGNTRNRRIKIDREQTELLLLKKVCAYLDPGLIQHFNLYLGAYDICGGLYVNFNYEFYKHGENRLSIISNNYSNAIANDAQSLESWTAHHAIFKLGYDFAQVVGNNACAIPTITAYLRTPIEGTRALLDTSIGLMLSCDF
jgi:hypothetical protein